MKNKKALLPVLMSAVIFSLGLAACNNPVTPGSSSQQGSSLVEEQEIVVTAAGDKKEIQVDETVQLSANVEGVEWSTRNDDIVSVSETGLVTGLKSGTARVTAKKDGYTNGNITLTVLKAPEREAKYALRLEEAEHYNPNGIWGMDLSQWGMGFMGPGETPVEDNAGATDDSTSLGWLQAGCKETLRFTSDKAVQVEIAITMAYNAVMNLGSAMEVKFNDVAISMSGLETVAPEDPNNYYEFHPISLGKVNLINGTNVLEIEMIAQGPNLDKVLIYTEEDINIAVIPAVVTPRIQVANADIKIKVEETAQIESETEGLSYVSANTEIATVSATGLVTGVAVGTTTITVSKEGMKDATVAVTVSPKPAAGQIVLEAEEGTLGGAAQIENNNPQASGGAHVGYLSAEASLTIKYTPENAGVYALTLVAASTANLDWSQYPNVTAGDQEIAPVMTLKLNNTPISLEGKVVTGGAFGTWVEVALGDVTLTAGENTFLFEFSGQAPNIDCLKLVAK